MFVQEVLNFTLAKETLDILIVFNALPEQSWCIQHFLELSKISKICEIKVSGCTHFRYEICIKVNKNIGGSLGEECEEVFTYIFYYSKNKVVLNSRCQQNIWTKKFQKLKQTDILVL